MNEVRNARHAYWALRIVLGVAAVLAGVDKFFNVLTNWEQYLSPVAANITHLSPVTFMHIVGIIELAVGIAILAGFTQLFGYVMCLWLLGIVGDLVWMGKFFDVALRDLGLSVSAFSLAQLSPSLATVFDRKRVPLTASGQHTMTS